MSKKQSNESPRMAVMFAEADIELVKQTWKEKGFASFGDYVRTLMKEDGVNLKPLKRGGDRTDGETNASSSV